jgi:hypothetical protein
MTRKIERTEFDGDEDFIFEARLVCDCGDVSCYAVPLVLCEGYSEGGYLVVNPPELVVGSTAHQHRVTEGVPSNRLAEMARSFQELCKLGYFPFAAEVFPEFKASGRLEVVLPGPSSYPCVVTATPVPEASQILATLN